MDSKEEKKKKAQEFGAELRKLRKGKTIGQIILYCNVSHSYISQLERGIKGIPSVEILKELAKGYNVSYEYLMLKAGYLDDAKIEIVQVKVPELPNHEILIGKLKEAIDAGVDDDELIALVELVKKIKKEKS